MAMQLVSHFAMKRIVNKACHTPGLQAHGIKCGQNFPGTSPELPLVQKVFVPLSR